MALNEVYKTGPVDCREKESEHEKESVSILIVDDDDVYRELIRDVVNEEGAQIVVAYDGVDAVEKLQDAPVDILITDLNMPRMDGLKLLAYARQIYPHILSIIVTGYGSLESAIEAIRQGAYDYVQKPFKIERIALVIKNAIDKIRILRDRARLLSELDAAYHRLQHLEASIVAARREDRNADQMLSVNGNHYITYPSVPLYSFSYPEQPAAQALTKLEKLQALRRDGIIDEKEFVLLKAAVIKNLGLKES